MSSSTTEDWGAPESRCPKAGAHRPQPPHQNSAPRASRTSDPVLLLAPASFGAFVTLGTRHSFAALITDSLSRGNISSRSSGGGRGKRGRRARPRGWHRSGSFLSANALGAGTRPGVERQFLFSWVTVIAQTSKKLHKARPQLGEGAVFIVSCLIKEKLANAKQRDSSQAT